MAFLLEHATLLSLLLLFLSKGFAEKAEDSELENLLASLEADSITKREETNDVEFPENLIDNVDHMKEERKLAGLEDFPNTIATDDGSMSIDASYEPVGCFKDHGGSNRPLPVLLASLRSQIDWHNLNKTIRACALLAKAKGYKVFGIQFYGECWSGPTADQTYSMNGRSDRCIAGVGRVWANYVYRFKQDGCSNYKELDSAQRSENYGPRGVYTCDQSLSKGWYRFTGQAGTHMATKCPQTMHCGTHAPGWMSGSLPSVVEGTVNRKVCFNWRKDCCYWNSKALVKNCGGYYVYRLQKPPHCRLKYCGSSTSAKRTFINDIPDTTTIGLPESGKEMTDVLEYQADMNTQESTEKSLHEGTEMDMFLDNGNDEVLDEYEQVGCYLDRGGNSRPLPILLANLRPKIDWKDLNKTIRSCASIAQAKGYRYFGIQFYGECWSGPNADQTYDKHGASSDGCVRGVGKAGSNFVYRFYEEKKTTVSPTTTANPLPVECSNYNELNSTQRSENYGPRRVYTCDQSLSKGWYRFTGQAGTHMATKCPQPMHCGTHAPGWMSGTLPSVAEGTVNRKVCFNWRNDCCYWDSKVLVKNCGGYYVYRLQKPPVCRLKYCGSDEALPTAEPPKTAKTTTSKEITTARPTTTEPTTTEPTTTEPTTTEPTTTEPTTTEVATTKPEGGECTNYEQLDSADRSENHGPNGIFTCDKTLTPGWYRFTGQAGTQMSTKCPNVLQCGTHAPGWMGGALPSVVEGIVKRKVCFNWNEDCCYFHTSVLVRNCGGFFVYELPKPPMCRLRYCGSNPALPTTSKPLTTQPTTRPPPPTPPTIPPTPIRTFRLCEHQSGVLQCLPGQKIKIRYANYGRTEGRHVCPHARIRTTKCYSSVAANLVRCACNGHNSCPLYAKNQVYGDPCVGTFKYIEVKYQCVHVIQGMHDIAVH